MTQGPYDGGGFVPGQGASVPGPPSPPALPQRQPAGYSADPSAPVWPPPPPPYPPYPPYPPPHLGYYGPPGYWPASPAAPPPPPRVWPCFIAVLCVFVGHLAVGLFLGMAIVMSQGPGAVTSAEDVTPLVVEAFARPPVFLGMMAATVLVTFAGGALPAALSPTPFRPRLRILRTRTRWWQDVLLVLGAVTASWALASIITILQLHREGVLADLDQALRRMSGAHLAIAILVIGVVGPIAEEILFRGYVQTRLRQRWGPAPAVLVTAALFGALHFDLVHSTFAFGLGVALGYATERSGSIWPAIWGHVVNNTLSVLSSAMQVDDTRAPGGAWTVLAIGAAVSVACVLLVEFTRPRRGADASPDEQPHAAA